jgi:hypothetical protein
MAAAIGTIPSFPTYQPGALQIAPTVYFEIVDSLNFTTALTWNMALQDIVGKAPSVMNYVTGDENQEIWYCANAQALASGATLTATFSSTTSGGSNQPAACCGFCTGIAFSAPLDKTNATKYEPGSAYSSGTTGTLSQQKELIIGALGCYNTSGAITEGPGFTTLNEAVQSGINYFRAHLAYQIVSATTSINYQPTFPSSNYGGSMIASFKGM